MNLIRINDGPLRGVVLTTRRRGIAVRVRATTRALRRRRGGRFTLPRG